MATRIPWLALGVLSTGVLAHAQVPIGIWQPISLSPLLLQNQIATSTVAANLTGHDYPDFAFLLGTQVALCTAPAMHNATDPILEGVTAYGLAPLPRSAAFGRDSLLVATATGLLQWELGATPVSLDGGNWRTACAGDFDGNNTLDLVGICTAARDRIRIVLRNGSSSTVSEIAFTGQTLSQLVIAQYDGTGPSEICVAGTGGLWIGTPSGPVRQIHLANPGPSLLARVGTTGADHLAWWVTVGGQRQLRTLSAGGQIIADATSLGTIEHFAANDLNGNRVGELVLSVQSNGQPLRLLNETGPIAGPNAVVQYDIPNVSVMSPFGNPLPPNQHWGAPCVVDINGDGEPDIIAPCRLTSFSGVASTVVWMWRRQPPTMSPRPILQDIVVTMDANQVTTYALNCDNVFTPGGAEPPTHLELLVFKTDTTNGFQTVPEGYDRVRVPFVQGQSTIAFDVDFNLTASRAFVGGIRWIRVVAGLTVRSWQPTRFALAANGDVIPYVAWVMARLQECTSASSPIWPDNQNNNYWMRPIGAELSGVFTDYRGDEEPPDLPPPAAAAAEAADAATAPARRLSP